MFMVSGSPLQSKRRQWRRRRMAGLRLSPRVRLRQRRPKQKVRRGKGTRASGVVFEEISRPGAF